MGNNEQNAVLYSGLNNKKWKEKNQNLYILSVDTWLEKDGLVVLLVWQLDAIIHVVTCSYIVMISQNYIFKVFAYVYENKIQKDICQ